MHLALSPYFLTTREPPAMAALLLADAVVTMMPTPGSHDRRAVADAVSIAPRYLDLLESWRWSVALWNAGVVTPLWRGCDAADDIREQFNRIADDDALADLRPFMHYGLFESEQTYLDMVARDVLRGGPDPGISVPVAAGMDAFAGRHGLMVARSAPSSLAQKVESGLAKNLVAIAVPVLTQASAEAILEARDILEPELADLRASLVEASAGAAPADLAPAAAAYSDRFNEVFDHVATIAGEEDIRVMRGVATLTLQRLPSDAVLRSSLLAARSVQAGPTRRAERRTTSAPAQTPPTSSALLAPEQARGVLSMIVKVLGRAQHAHR